MSNKNKIFIPRKLSKSDHRWMDHNNSQPIKDGVRINQYDENGLKQGYWEVYLEDTLIEKGNYVNGEREGYWEYYYSDGKLDSKGNYVNGEREGYWESYYENGVLLSKGNYVNGVREGYWEIYWNNGVLEKKGNYVNGDRDGYWERYYMSGRLNYKGLYKNGEKVENLTESEKKKLFIPRKLSKDDSRFDEWNNLQPVKDGVRINQFDEEGRKQGYWEDYYPSGQIEYKGNYVDGKKDGYWESYYGNGQINSKGNFVNGRREGHWEYYYISGQLWSKGSYVDDKEEGYWVDYHKNGEIMSKGYYENDELVQDLTESEKKKLFIPRKLSKGDSRFDDHNNSQPIKDGKRINQYDYEGKKIGYWEHYWSNGELWSKGNYIDGKMNGYWEFFYENGQLWRKDSYVDGKKDGYSENYHYNGKLKSKGSYVNDKADGYWVFYYPNDELWYKGNYINGNKDGYWEEYWNNGKLLSKGEYKDGDKDGYWEEYFITGKLNYKGYYKEGEFIKKLTESEKKKLLIEGGIDEFTNNIISKLKTLPFNIKKRYLTMALSGLIGYSSYPVIQTLINKSPDKQTKQIIKQVAKEKILSDFKDGTKLRLSKNGFDHIVNSESPELIAYDLKDGKITIGYGHAEPILTTKLKVGDKISLEQAKKYLKDDLKVAADGVRRMFNDWKKQGKNYKVTQDMFDALVSMAFNMGVSGLRKSQMVQYLKSGQYKTAGQMIKKTSIDPVSFPGLEKRRKKESEMFLSFLNKEKDTNV